MEQANTYLTLFLQDNEQLINYLSAYNNIMLSVSSLMSCDPEEVKQNTLSPAQADKVMETIGFFRSYATRTYIRFESIKGMLGATKKQTELIENNYKKISTQNIPTFEICFTYVQTLNDILASNINAGSVMNKAKKTKDYTTMAQVPQIDDDYE